jgi:two-component system sensor histidine kinase VicK
MQPAKQEPFRLQDAVHTAVRQLGREWQWAATNATERISVYLDNVPPVQSDRSGVSQVLQQLIDNALKFSPEGGPIEILAGEGDGGVWVAVRDYGIGIAKHEYQNIFRAFYQVNSSTTRPFGGAGIGLTIVKMILDKLSVPFELDSAPGEGSTFRFWLPLAEL